FLDSYWEPFKADQPHRMYSVTKSFVSVAIGLAEEDGLIDLDKKIATYFPDKWDAPLGEWLSEQTVRQMLTMTTVGSPHSWFRLQVKDRTRFYFDRPDGCRPAGTAWEYDSAGSQVLSSLVERVTGKRLFDYLNERIFQKLGAFSSAKILSTPNGDSWGDSAMICTPQDLATFARFVMNYGVWQGERLMNEAYLRRATSAVVSNRVDGFGGVFAHGYGYQFWRTEHDGFAFVGMGDQIAICCPKEDLIMVCTADNQGCPWARPYIVTQFMDRIVEQVHEGPLPANREEVSRLNELLDSLTLYAVKGEGDSPWREKLNGAVYACLENSLTWKNFTFRLDGNGEGELRYTNARGEMVLPFSMNRNRFGKFPELGYSRERGGERTTDGHRYRDAVSAAWLDENKLLLHVQIIDEYFGNLSMLFSFREDMAVIQATRTAEDFLWDYNGEIVAKRQSEVK
ncbi:MAG: serine hydrolase, partial [Clostridia bacterium]|nr:serine hydrolase [Clostridia bacterium]